MIKKAVWIGMALAAVASASAQDAAPASESSMFLFSTLLLLACGATTFLAAAGFAMIEAGLARAGNAAVACLKHIAAAAAVAGAMALCGYRLLYGVEPGGFLGAFERWTPRDVDPVGLGWASAADFSFNLLLATLAALIVSGALAERVRLSAYLMFTAVFAALIYPIGAGWAWGGGYLAGAWRFVDLGGSAVVHAAGGAAALAGALVIGARRGRYKSRGAPPAGDAPAAALGALFVAVALLAAIAGAERSYAAIGDAIAIATRLANAQLAAAGGAIAALLMTASIYRRADAATVVNGLVGGLVSIAADPLSPALWQAALIGAFGGVLVTVGGPLLDRLRIDDATGAAPTHLFCGVWGALVVPWTNADASLLAQLVGVAMLVGFAFVMSALAWLVLKYSIGARVAAEDELAGLDSSALGLGEEPD
jgi:Amt family ammonium transporter